MALALIDRMDTAMSDATGLSRSAGHGLLLVAHGHVAQIGDLRAPLGLSHAGAVRLVDGLERRSLVERRRGQDGRSRALGLTPDGLVLVDHMLAARRAALGELLGAAEATALARLAEAVLGRLATDRCAGVRLCRGCDEGACDLSRCPVELAVACERRLRSRESGGARPI
jgi:DNA-binding MarR family transcriptional regulator